MKIKVSPEEFFNVIMIYLLDKINNPEKVGPWNDEIDDIIDKMRSTIKGDLINHYLSLDSDQKIYYKRIRDVFKKTDFSGNYTISIKDKYANESTDEQDDLLNEENIETGQNISNQYEIRSIIKETIQKIKKRKFYKSTYLSESELDAIINNVIKNNKRKV